MITLIQSHPFMTSTLVIRPRFSRSKQGRSSPSIYCCDTWNDLPEQIKTRPSVASFKSALKQFLINKYWFYPLITIVSIIDLFCQLWFLSWVLTQPRAFFHTEINTKLILKFLLWLCFDSHLYLILWSYFLNGVSTRANALKRHGLDYLNLS